MIAEVSEKFSLARYFHMFSREKFFQTVAIPIVYIKDRSQYRYTEIRGVQTAVFLNTR